MDMKILDVCSNPLITSECWTYYKFAVMQTSDYFDVWLTNHMDLYIDQNGTLTSGNIDSYCVHLKTPCIL